MARSGLFRHSAWRRWVLKGLGAFPVERGAGRAQPAVAHAAALVAGGFPVVVFAEGTRSRDGRLQPLKAGIDDMARLTPAPLVPVWLEGLYEVNPRGAPWLSLRAHPVTVWIGRAWWPRHDAPAGDLVRHLTKDLEHLHDHAKRDAQRGIRPIHARAADLVLGALLGYVAALRWALKPLAWASWHRTRKRRGDRSVGIAVE